MLTGRYRMAGRVVEICARYPDVLDLCRGYESAGIPDFSVAVTDADLALEREKSAREALAEGRAVPSFTDAELEETAVCRKIAEQMPAYGTVLFHGSAVAVDGQAYLFTAKSGTGKSTHTRLWREMLGSRAVMVNDDKPLLRMDADGFLACGSPYNGKHRLGSNLEVPLKALCILTRAQENRIVRITKQEAYPMLLQQVYRPANPAALKKTLTLIDRLAAVTPLFRLGCNMEPEAAQVAYRAMKG